GTLSFFTATTVFGTAVDITFSELIIESFMPGDAFTAAAVREAMGE
ncbi:MAG: transcriptional regulator, partial [Parvibaculum sp.]|nr:transcriptional regulator [Parvibaculum sp.]